MKDWFIKQVKRSAVLVLPVYKELTIRIWASWPDGDVLVKRDAGLCPSEKYMKNKRVDYDRMGRRIVTDMGSDEEDDYEDDYEH